MLDSTLLYRLWGKTNERDRNKPDDWQWKSHPAICHMVDVGYVAETWLSLNPNLLDRFHRFAPDIDRDELRRIIVTIVALHDLGKLSVYFQAKSEEGWKRGYGELNSKIFNGTGFDHGRATARMIRKLIRNDRSKWKSWKSAIDMAAAHHGKLYESSALAEDLAFLDERPVVLEAIDVLERLFGTPETLPPSPKNNAFNMLLAGFTAVCDWFGSDSTTYPYQHDSIRSFDDIESYLNRLRSDRTGERQLGEAGILNAFRREELSYPDLFPILRKYPLRPLQKISQDIPFGREEGPEMLVVEAPMGMGKTEIALYNAARAIGKGNAGGVYFALPTQASSNALYDRVTGFVESVREPEGDVSIVLAHGGRRYFEKYQQLRKRTYARRKAFEESIAKLGSYRDAEAPPSEIIATSWLQGSKQSLLGGVGVGTIDQAMLGAIIVKHAFVRLFALSDKVVVFDEIHSYDSYMNQVILRLLGWLHLLGAKVVLLSATLSRNLRNDLLAAYGAQAPTDEPGSPEFDPYPQILYARAGSLTERFVVPDEDRAGERTLNVRIRRLETNAEERTAVGARTAVELAAAGGCIAWIRNTVREAQEAWREVQAELDRGDHSAIRLCLIHARFTRTDRNRIEEELVGILGNDEGAARPERIIVVATQVIEQSVDIDFDAMISDLAPVDLLLQRLGRMWRHQRPIEVRHEHTEPTLYVLTPDVDDLRDMRFGSSAYVYESEVLSRSAVVTVDDQIWSMPDACRTLVAEVYDRPESYWTAEMQGVDPERLESIRQKSNVKSQDESGRARHILMPPTDATSLTMEDAHRDDDRGERIALATRLGGASGTVVLLERGTNGIEFVGHRPDAPRRRIEPLPTREEISASIDIEEAVTLSAISFPWWDVLEPLPYDDPALTALDVWWRDRHPYDNKIFLLFDETGRADGPGFSAFYRRDRNGNPTEGLVIVRDRELESEDEVDFSAI